MIDRSCTTITSQQKNNLVNALMLNNDLCEYIGKQNPFEEDFNTFVILVDKLSNETHVPIPLTSCLTAQQIIFANRRKCIDYTDTAQKLLFVHQGNEYYGNQRLYDSTKYLRENKIEHNVPKYIVNLYIELTLSGHLILMKLKKQI